MMKLLSRYGLMLSIMFFIALVAVTYPFYRYYVDTDATAYLSIARHFVNGDRWRLVNSLWSPLSPCLTALMAMLLGGGSDPYSMLEDAHVVNAIACILLLVVQDVFLKRLLGNGYLRNTLMLVLPVFLLYAMYEQLFDDLWQVLFLMIYLLIVTWKEVEWSWVAAPGWCSNGVGGLFQGLFFLFFVAAHGGVGC